MDTHQYLEYSSCYPKHVKRSIPYGQALRLKRICGSGGKLRLRLDELHGHFRKRGYKSEFLNSEFSRGKKRSRNSLLCQV